jgi:succinoglycan biosynthesis transport protein ExoP
VNAIVRRPLRSALNTQLGAQTLETGAPAEAPTEPSLYEYWRIVKKHRWLILTIFTITVVTVAVVTAFMTRVFTAETVILIDPRAPQVVDVKQVFSDLRSDPQELHDFYVTQIEMLKGRSLAAEVVGKERLFDEPYYRKKVENLGKNVTQDDLLQHLTKLYADKILAVTPIKNSRLVKIEISTPDAVLSARLANAHAQAYIAQGLNIRTRASQDALNFLQGKLEELKQRVQVAENALNTFRRERGVVSLDSRENIVVDRLSDLNRRLTEAEVERIALEAQVILIRKRAYDSIPAVVNNPLVQTLKGQLSRLEAEYASLGTNFTPEYPQLVRMKAEIDQTRQRLDREVRRIVGSIESAFLSSDAKEKKLRAAMEEQKDNTYALKDAAVGYAVLAREAESNRQLYESVLQRIKEIGVAAELRASNVFVVDQAKPPLKPSKPKVLLYLAVGGLFGLAGGLAAGLLKEYLDNTLRNAKDVEEKLHLPNLATVPRFPGPEDRNLPLAADHNQLTIIDRPHSAVAEAYSMLHTSIKYSNAGSAPKSILITSGVPGEGKTVTAVNTAIACARMGSRVLLIDADLRNSSCHQVMGIKKTPGLVEVITGQSEVLDVTRPTSVQSLHFVPSGSTPPTPAALLGSKKMQELISELSNSFDLVIIDSPPVLPVTDAVLLSKLVDGVILVVDSQTTAHQITREAQTRLHYADANLLGVVLNKSDLEGEYVGYYRNDRYWTEDHQYELREAET